MFVGRTFPNEKEIVSSYGVPFLPLTAGRLTRVFTLHTVISFLKIPIGFLQAWMYCVREHPSLVVSFGGYIALPVTIVAWMLGIPVITHEQTRAAGLTNRIIAHIAKRICVTFEDTTSQFPSGKTVVTGLPLRSALFNAPKPPPYRVNENKYPILYITGGSLGAHSLNKLIYPIVSTLTKSWTVIHQVGSHSLSEARKIKNSRYIVEAYIPVVKNSWVLAHAKLVVARSGANTAIELAALGKVSLLVPLPWAAADEQLRNAQWLVARGGAKVISQKKLTSQKLLAAITSMRLEHEKLQSRARTFAPHIYRDGDARFAAEIKKLLT